MFARAFRPLAAVLAAVFLTATAQADPIKTVTKTISFDFDGLSNGAGNAAVQTHMNGLLSAAGLGTVTVRDALVQTNYMADGFIVGPVVNGQVVPQTLGYPTPGDAYLVNDGSGPTGDRITMEFSFPVYGVSFDFQIFPSAGWQANTPDFSLWADGVMVYQKFGVKPGQDGTFAHSQMSGLNANEVVPQFLGSYSHTFGTGVTKLEFRDWPVRIGIDNVVLVTSNSQSSTEVHMPEPATVVVVAAVAGVLSLRRLRRKPAAV